MDGNLLTGLAGINQYKQEQEAKREAANRPKAEWFKWPKNVNVATVRFLQEFDTSATNYREDRGLALIAVEHQAPGPDGYKRRGLCTRLTDGECFPCEKHELNYKEGWRQRVNLYINALVQFGSEAPVPLVISRTFNSSFSQALIEEAVDEGSVTDANYKITRTGEGTSTQWLLKRLKGDPFDDTDVEVFSLTDTAVRTIEYDKQAEYYGAVYQPETVGASSAPATSSADAEW